MTDQQSPPFAEWCIVEMLGHRRLAGYLSEVQVAGQGFLRLDIPDAGNDPGRTQFLAPGSIYALHPVTEATARKAAASWRPEPISHWELTAIATLAPEHPNPPYGRVEAFACGDDYFAEAEA